MPYSESIRSDVLAGVQSYCSHPMLHSIFVRVAYGMLRCSEKSIVFGLIPAIAVRLPLHLE